MLAAINVTESIQIMELHLSPFGGQQALVLKTSKHAAHCFFGYAEVITDIAARHAQVKFGA